MSSSLVCVCHILQSSGCTRRQRERDVQTVKPVFPCCMLPSRTLYAVIVEINLKMRNHQAHHWSKSYFFLLIGRFVVRYITLSSMMLYFQRTLIWPTWSDIYRPLFILARDADDCCGDHCHGCHELAHNTLSRPGVPRPLSFCWSFTRVTKVSQGHGGRTQHALHPSNVRDYVPVGACDSMISLSNLSTLRVNECADVKVRPAHAIQKCNHSESLD